MELMSLNATQLAALALQSLGALVLGLILWLIRLAHKKVVRVLERIDHLDKCLDDLKEKVLADREEQAEIKVEQRESAERITLLREEVAHLKGTMGLALHEEPKSA